MSSLREIKRRIRSVSSTQQITKAMEMVSAAKLRKAQMRAEQSRPYNQKLELILSNLSSAVVRPDRPPPHPYFEQRTVKKTALVVITGDRGLCGSFNANVIRRALLYLRDFTPENVELVCIGKRGFDWFRRREYPIAAHHLDFGGDMEFGRVREITAELTSRFVSGEVDAVEIVYTRFITTARCEVVLTQYLPIATGGDTTDGGAGGADYIFEPVPEAIFSELMPRYASSLLQMAMSESLASEHAARMMAMGAATTSAGEMIDSLTLTYNKARQSSITKELLDIIGGAEALK